jgi:DNA-binding protein H-NS
MAKTYEQIQQQIETLQREADALRAKEVAGVIEKIKAAIDAYGLTAADLGLAKGPRKPKAQAAPARRGAAKKTRAAKSGPKYRDDQGNEWVGRGKRPQWIKDALAAGKTLEELAA